MFNILNGWGWGHVSIKIVWFTIIVDNINYTFDYIDLGLWPMNDDYKTHKTKITRRKSVFLYYIFCLNQIYLIEYAYSIT